VFKFAHKVRGGVGAKSTTDRSGVLFRVHAILSLLTVVGMSRHAKAKSAVVPRFIGIVGQFVAVSVYRFSLKGFLAVHQN
jgi:hypothetical protein